MSWNRRAFVASAAVAPFFASAAAQQPALPAWLREHSAMSAWDAPERPSERLLNARVEPEPGAPVVPIREWLGGRPTVLAVWATWCPPCLVEKEPEARLHQRLAQAGSATQVKGLLAYDRASLAQARQTLASLNASALETGRAAESAEQALLWTFGLERDRRSMRRTENVYAQLSTTLPFTLLIGADGTLLGTMTGRAVDDNGRAYWSHPAVFDLMQRLGDA